jgi:hypothetical protein
LSLFGSSSSPAAPELAAAAPAAPQPALAKIVVAPIIGAPDQVGKQIRQEFTSAVEKQRVTVVAGKEERADYTLRGYIVASKEKTGTKVAYIWDVTDPAGKRVNRITGEELVTGANASKDPWVVVTPQVSQSIGNKAANLFAAWLPSQAAVASNAMQPASSAGAPPPSASPEATPVAAASPPAKQRVASAAKTAPVATAAAEPGTTTGSIGRQNVMAVVPSVTGAPGDGSASLTSAIQRELTSKGVALADKPTGAAYRVEGSVTMGAAKEGKQPIHIEWLVRDPQGKKLGTVSQRNEIPEGSLDGAWGSTATQAASAAAQGIVKLLPQQKAVN